MLKHVPNFPDPGSGDHKTYPIYFYFQKCYKLNAQFQNPMGRSYILGSPSPVDCAAVAEMSFLNLFENIFHHSSFTSTMEVIKMKVYLGNNI